MRSKGLEQKMIRTENAYFEDGKKRSDLVFVVFIELVQKIDISSHQ